jgi:hypothetical protein
MSVAARALVLAALAALAGACSSGEAAPPDGGAGTGGLTEMNCQQIRLCVAQTPCATEACIDDCVAKGSAAARTTFAALRACTASACAVDDVTCACDEQCLADGACTTETDACLLGLSADVICDNICH